MTDIVERLRDLARVDNCQASLEAADEIERLRAVLEEAARVAEYRCGSPEWSVDTNSGYDCAAKEIAAAIRALKEKPHDR